MRFHRRPLIPGGHDPELLWGSILFLAALLGTVWLASGIPTPLCPLHSLSGIPCPTCGTTRAAGALLHGDVKAAFIRNPLMTAVFLAAVLYIVYAAVVVIGRLPRPRWTTPSRTESYWIRISAIALIASNWVYLIWRGV